MPQSVSTALRTAVNADSTDEVFLLLLRIDDPSLSEPIRVVNNLTPITSNGEKYVGHPFEVALPDEDPDQAARVQLRIDNVGEVEDPDTGETVSVAKVLRAVEGQPTVELEVVLASDPHTVEAGPFAMTLVQTEVDALVISGDLAFEDVLNEPFPGLFTPVTHPGLF